VVDHEVSPDRVAGPAPGEPRPAEHNYNLERLMFFCDAVFAIALTLLALDLPLPTGNTNTEQWASFRHLWSPNYLSFLLSFVVIATCWRSHHRFFAQVERCDGGLINRNLVFLFGIVILPYATRMIGSRGTFQVDTVVYASVVTLVGGSLMAAVWHSRAAGLLRSDVPAWAITAKLRGLAIPTFAFLVSIPISFGSTSLAQYSWLVLAVGTSLVLRLIDRLRHRGAAPVDRAIG